VVNEMSQQHIRDSFDDGMEQILLISGKQILLGPEFNLHAPQTLL